MGEEAHQLAPPPRLRMGLILLRVGGQGCHKGGHICYEAHLISSMEGVGAELWRLSFENGEGSCMFLHGRSRYGMCRFLLMRV